MEEFVEEPGHQHGDVLARAIGQELECSSSFALDLKILDDEVVVAFPSDGAAASEEETAAVAAVFAGRSPRGHDLLAESFVYPDRFYLAEGRQPGRQGLADGHGGRAAPPEPARVVVDPRPGPDGRELYRRVDAVVVPDERAAAGEIARRAREAHDAAYEAASRRRTRESLGQTSRLENLRAEMRADQKAPVLSTGQLEEAVKRGGDGSGRRSKGLKNRGFLSRALLGFFAALGLVSVEEEEEERGAPTWRRRIPPWVGDLVNASPFPAVAVITNNKGGTGKCVTFDTKLTDPVTGLPHAVEEFVRNPGLRRVHTLEDRRRTTGIEITEKVDSGTKPTLKVRLRSGRSITVTLHHPLLAPDGWRKTEDIAVGETIALANREPFPEEAMRLLDAEVDLWRPCSRRAGPRG